MSARRATLFLIAVVVVAPATLSLLAQSGGRVAPRGDATRTADGASDLEGVWNFSSLTPVERPAEFAGRATMTAAEAAKYASDVRDRNNADRRDGSVDADLARAYNDAWYDRGTHLAMLNGIAQTSLVVDPPDGRIPALTPAAQQRQAARAQDRRDHPADGPENRSLAERCLGFNAGPPMLPGPYNNFVQIFQGRDYVIVFNEMIHDARVVPVDGRAHPPASVRKYLGDSIGHWEGTTLVVDTTNFTDRTNFRGASERLHLIERFTRADANTLRYEFTVDDPASFTKPWKVVLPMTRSDEPIFEYACHEGNEAMQGILRGARFGERTPQR